MAFASILLGVYLLAESFAGQGDVTLVFAGDAMQHERQLNAAYRKADKSYNYNDCFTYVKDFVSKADYAVVNLECTLGGKPYTGYPCFSAPVEYAQALKDAGFDLFLHANNHCLDRRDAGLIKTGEALDALGVPHIGTYRDVAARNDRLPFITEIKGIKFAFLNYTYGTNGIEPQGKVVVDYIDKKKIHSDVVAARNAGADMIVACMHWGVEYKLVQNKQQEQLAQFLKSEGVDLIIGGHPHVIQPMALTEDANGKSTLTIYSLGNFISGMRTADTRGGAMLKVTVSRTGNGVIVKDATYRLVFVQDPTSSVKNYQLIPADRPELVQKGQQSIFNAFVGNARNIFNKYNKNVTEYDGDDTFELVGCSIFQSFNSK